MNIKSFLRKNWHVFFIILFVALLGILNYTKNTYLTGWDNLQTELNPLLAIKRAIFSVWQEYQSFGLIAGMAHAADLPRSILNLLFALILPQHMVRYVMQTCFIFMGAIGAFFLFAYSMENVVQKKLFALLASLIYVVNIGSIQILSLPFETFSIFFASLPWLILSIFILLDSKKHITRKNIIFFVLIQFISSSFAVSQQLFVVYGLLVGVIFICHLARNPSKQSIIRIVLLGCLILVCNLYWILPQVEFLRTNGSVVQTSKINQLSTEDIYYRNLEKGTLNNFFFIKNFFLDTVDMKNSPMFLPWLQWYEFLWTKIALYIITCIALLGIFSHKRYSNELKLLYGIFAIALLSNTPFFSNINTLIRNNSFVNQIFRSPFTKFVIPYSLVFSFLFAEGLGVLYSILKFILNKYTILFIGILVSICIGIIAYPAFDGYLYSKELKVKIPSDYISAITYFRGVDTNKRIALLPDYTYWGWFFHSWGYNGSGFLWYGIEQPIISRTFDVWSRESENYYWEIKQAIESEDSTLFQNVANKYNVSYFLLDKSLLPITSSAKGMQYERLDHILTQMPSIRLIQHWGDLYLFENIDQSKIQNFITVSSNLPTIGPVIKQTSLDTAYEASRGYVTKQSGAENDTIYPFLNLMSQTRQSNPDWNISENDSEFIIESLEKIDFSQYEIVFPSKTFHQTLYTEQGVTSSSGTLYSLINTSGHFMVRIPKILLRTFNPAETEVTNCGNVKGQLHVERTQFLHVTTNNQANACFGYTDATLDQNYGYLAIVTNERLRGRSFLFYTLDLTKKESVIEERLKNNTEYFIIPPRYEYGLGYNFSFQQNSYTNIPSENILNQLTVYAFPFSEMKQIRFIKKNVPEQMNTQFMQHESSKLNYYTYVVSLQNREIKPQYISLYQSFHPGWKAYELKAESGKLNWLQTNLPFLFGTELKDHVLVNNWANGWLLESQKLNTQIVIVFWPQYLEYIGFILLGATFIAILLYHSKND